MNEAEFKAERAADDSWTSMKLIVLGAVTLSGALAVIYFFASRAAPY